MKNIVKNVEIARKMFGSNEKKCTESEFETRKLARRSIVANRDIKKGDVFTSENLSCKRPGTGLSPILYKKIIGQKSIRNIKFDDILTEKDIADF